MEIRVDGWWKSREDGKFVRPIHLSIQNRHLMKFNSEKTNCINALDNFGRTPLIIACLIQSGKRELKVLFDLGAKVDFVWKTCNPYCKITPLGIAVHFSDLDMMKSLLSQGADPNIQLFNGFTALHLAVILDNCEMVDLLIQANADANIKDDFGYTPLHLAAVSSVDVLKCILDSPTAKIISCGPDGETPLHIAAHANNLVNVKLLIERQAAVKFEMRNHWTPVDCSPDGTDVRKFLLSDCDAGQVCKLNTSKWEPFLCYLPAPLIALMREISSKSFLLAEMISEDGLVNVLSMFKVPSTRKTANVEPNWFWVPNVTGFPNLAVKQILSDYSLPSIGTRDSSSMPYEYVQERLRAGDIMEEKDYFPCFMHLIRTWGSFTCSYKALALGGLCLKLLISAGVDVNAKDENGYTPLFVLIEDGFENPAVYLLDNGADPNLRVNGVTPLMMASIRGLKEVVFALLARGAAVNAEDKNEVGPVAGVTSLHLAAYYSLFSPPEVMDALIAEGASVNARGPAGITALHLSAVSLSSNRCKHLLDAGAYIDVKVFDLQPVDLAFLFMNIAAAAILKSAGDLFKSAIKKDLKKLEIHLYRGAAVNCQRSDLGTPLMCLTGPMLTLHALLLLKYDPDYTMKDKYGLTAIHHAVKNKNYCTLVMFLRKWGIEMLFEGGSEHHIDHLITLADESEAPDWVMRNETSHVLRGWKDVFTREGPDRLSKLINKHFYDYVGFAALMLKFGWPNAMHYFKEDACS